MPTCVYVCYQTVSVYREVTRLRACPRNVESRRSPSCALWGEDVGEGSETARGQQQPSESERENVRSMYVGGRTDRRSSERARGIDSNQTRWKDIVAARDGRRKGGRVKSQGCSWREDK